ncbi:prephenate dehydratase [bacterium]|nr:prephenate dehydratase [bacterium]
MSTLDEHRRQIDAIDDKIVALLAERLSHVLEIGRLKDSAGGVVYDPAREHLIYDRLTRRLSPPLTGEDVVAVFREIISLCRNKEKPIRVAYLGPEGSFSQIAGISRFGHAAHYVACPSFPKVFDAVQNGGADYGLVAIENSTQGTVPATVDAFLDSNLQICAEVYVNAVHNLVGAGPLSEVTTVFSHPQAIAQCRRWLEANLPGVELWEVGSTSIGALKARETPRAAAIASKLAAEKYGLSILAESIQDSANNITRFLVVGHHDCAPSGQDKTSMIVLVRNRPGALFDALRHFKNEDINLCKIESRPTRKAAWEYMFFIDCDGHREDEKLKRVLASLEQDCLYLKLLGSYPSEAQRTI